MDNLILLIACLLIGMLLRRSGRLPADAHVSLNGFIIHVSLPALTLSSVHSLVMERSLLALAGMAWIMFGLGYVFFTWVGRRLGLSARTTGALILTGSLANTSFVGVPMIETYFSHHAVGLGLFIDRRTRGRPGDFRPGRRAGRVGGPGQVEQTVLHRDGERRVRRGKSLPL
jgi:predicted permease